MKNRLSFENLNYRDMDRAFKSIKKEQESVGYYTLPMQETQTILDYTSSISEEIESVAVIGIGGSSLGAKAIYEFIKPVKKLKRELYFFESTDPVNIHSTLSKIDLKKTHFFVISKSGTTIETFSIYKYIYSLQKNSKSYTFITDKGSLLEKYANDIGSKVLFLPNGVGGRFSVLSVVGLAPLALCSIDIKELLNGALKIRKSFFENGYIKDTLLKKASFYATNHAKYHINCLFAYTESLKYFCEWYVQLWGESLGKRQRHSAFNVGLTPIGLIGPKDQHSFLQLIMEGVRDKSVTFIKVEDFEDSIAVPDITLSNLESLDCLNDITFSNLINLQCSSVVEALENEGDVPIDTISIPKIDEFNIGSLIFYYQLLTSLVGELIDVDTYNQPGVEAGKIILNKKLNREG